MYILCTKEEYRALIASCAKSARVKDNLLKCKHCCMQKMCYERTSPGDLLSEFCVLIPEGGDASVLLNEPILEEPPSEEAE